uniref:ATPase H+ transporting V1 subunit G1 n=1 Tax=Equus asinus TaxID=9793 RepID=A0A9L0K734_EQUAS
MASQSQGIQQLLQAEKRAAEKVSEARKRSGIARQLQQRSGEGDPAEDDHPPDLLPAEQG